MPQEKNIGFRKQYYSIPRGLDNRPTEVREQILEECEISYSVFYNWLKGLTPLPKHQKPIIAKILQCSVNDLF